MGRTERGHRRVFQHAEKGWFEREVAVMTFERVPVWSAAEAERQAIQNERPKYNVVHYRAPKQRRRRRRGGRPSPQGAAIPVAAEALSAAAILWRYIGDHPDRFPFTPRQPDGSPWPAEAVDGRAGLGPVAGEVAVLENVVRRELAASGHDPESVKVAWARAGLIRRGEGTNVPRKVALVRAGIPGAKGTQPRMLQLHPVEP